MTYGDGLANVNIDKLIHFHEQHGKMVTLTGISPKARFGSIEFGDDMLIKGFEEKPIGESGYVNGGFFVISPKALQFIDDDNSNWEKDVLPNIAKKSQLMCFKHEGFWQPMDTLRDQRFLNELWKKRKLRGKFGIRMLDKVPDLEYFYNKKRILVTGHTGFKGGWLTVFLKEFGSKVFGISLDRKKISIQSGFDHFFVNDEILTDINNVNKYKKEVLKFNPEILFYFASQPLVRSAYLNPLKTIKSNVMGLSKFLNFVGH